MPAVVERLVRVAAERGIRLVAAFNRWRRRATDHPFLVGVHRPVSTEYSLRDLPVTGSIPPGLAGQYLKMGANPVRPDPTSHWFLGDGMVHGVALRDGRASWYRNRWILSRTAAVALGREPAPGPRRGRNDTVNTNVAEIGGRPFALVEAGSFPVRLSPDLEAQRYDPFDGTLAGSFSGHPHRDPASGEVHAIAYDGAVWDTVRHVVLSPAGRVVRDQPIPVTKGPCIHDCGITARYAVVLDLPVTFSMRAVLGGHAFPFRWNPKHPARVGLLPRDGNAVIWCDVEPCFVFHVGNAFDDGDRVVMDVVAYPTMFTGGASGLDALGRLERWTVDPGRRRVDRRVLDETPQEFPRIDERRFASRHRFLFAVQVPPDGNTQLVGATRIYRHDLETGERQEHDFGDGHLPGEFVFVPGGVVEGEGWLMGWRKRCGEETWRRRASPPWPRPGWSARNRLWRRTKACRSPPGATSTSAADWWRSAASRRGRSCSARRRAGEDRPERHLHDGRHVCAIHDPLSPAWCRAAVDVARWRADGRVLGDHAGRAGRLSALFSAACLGRLHLRYGRARPVRLLAAGDHGGEPLFLTIDNPYERFRVGDGPGSFARGATLPGCALPADRASYLQFTKQNVQRWTTTDDATTAAYIAYLEKVGPSVVMVHSQGGLFG